jgi:hypothetical protein
MITSMGEDLDGFPGVLRERRVLEAAHLGDPDGPVVAATASR